MSLRKGYRVPSQIVTNDTRDTYPLIDINDSLGGSHIYNIEAEMLAIPVQRRREGMRCYLITPKRYYKLINNPSTSGTTITDWEELAEISVNEKKTFVTNSSLATTLSSYAKISDLPNMSLYTTTAVLEANYVKIVDLKKDYLDKTQLDAKYLTINDYNTTLPAALAPYAKLTDLPNMSLYYTITAADAKFVTQTDLTTNYYTSTDVDNKFLTKNDYNTTLPAALAPYAKLTDLPNMSLYYTITAADAKFVTQTDLAANYYTSTDCDNKFVTKTDLTTNYYTSTDVDTKFLTKADYNTTLATTLLDYAKLTDLPNMSLYYTITAADAKFATKTDLTTNYYTSTDCDNKFVTKTDLTTNYYTSSDVDTKFVTKTDLTTNYYTSTDVDNKFVTKTDLTKDYYTAAQCDTNFPTKKDLKDVTDKMEKTIIAITRPDAISVVYGTTAAQVATKLPPTIKVTMADGSSADLPVVWNVSTFNDKEEGMQVINGDLTLPPGTINPQVNATMHVKVSEKVYILDDFVDVMPLNITAPYGAKFEELGLPSKLKVQYIDGTVALVDVEWTNSPKQYDEIDINAQTINGKIILPPNAKQSTPEKQPQVVVAARVKPLQVTAFTPFPVQDIDEGTLFHDVTFPANTTVTLEDGSTTTLDIIWEPSGYNSFVAGNQTLFGKFVPKTGVDIPVSMIPNITVNIVRPPNMAAVADLDLISLPVGSTIADVGLPTTVNVTLLHDDGTKSVSPFSISWNTSKDISNPGFYTFEGDIVIPSGTKVKNVLGLKAYQDVQITAAPVKVISSFTASELTPFSVANGDAPATFLSRLSSTLTLNLKDSTGANSTVSLRVKRWDTSAYNENIPGTYPIVAEFDPADLAANNINNPSGLQATVMVTVAAAPATRYPNVTRIEVIPDSTTLPVGSPLSDVQSDMPSQVNVDILEIDGSTTYGRPYNVSWNDSTYNPNQAGSQIIRGTITNLPTGCTNTGGLIPEFTVTLTAAPVVGPVSDPEVISVDPIADTAAPAWGCAISEIPIPTMATVTIKKPDGTNMTMSTPITWNTTSLDTHIAGSYIIKGGLNSLGDLDGVMIENPRNVEAEIKVTIPAKPVDPILTVGVMPTPLTYPFGTSLSVVKRDLPQNVDLVVTDPSNGATTTLNVPVSSWDTSSYSSSDGTYSFDATLTLPTSGYNLTQLGVVSISVTVEPKAADPTSYSINQQFVIPQNTKTWSDPILNNISEQDFYGYNTTNDDTAYASRTVEVLFVGVDGGVTMPNPIPVPSEMAPDADVTKFRQAIYDYDAANGTDLKHDIPNDGNCTVAFDPENKVIEFSAPSLTSNCVFIIRKTGDGSYVKYLD